MGSIRMTSSSRTSSAGVNGLSRRSAIRLLALSPIFLASCSRQSDMRFLSSLFNLTAIGKKGAIVDPTDSEFVLPAVYQISSEIPSPIAAVNLTAQTRADSHFDRAQISQVGVQAAGSQNANEIFSAGLWHIQGTGHVQFAGTVN